jgi:2-polyprenyl-3-methyl-5-hydroxy-6-metoxy-1,4-benzoquinol methylase
MTHPLPDLRIPPELTRDEMPDLLRHWYLGSRARRHMMTRRFAEVDRHLDARRGRRVLDVGSAWGFHVMTLQRMGFIATGVDLVPDQFAVGERIAAFNGVSFDVAGADVAALPFRDATFDHVTLVETLEHIYEADRPRAMAECHRVLKPGGRLVLSTPNHAGAVERGKRFAVRHGWMRGRVASMCLPDEGTPRAHYHPYRYHRPVPDAEIVALVEQAGLRVVSVSHFLFTMKNTPDALARAWRLGERVFERTPGLRRLAATVCVAADRP